MLRNFMYDFEKINQIFETEVPLNFMLIPAVSIAQNFLVYKALDPKVGSVQCLWWWQVFLNGV